MKNLVAVAVMFFVVWGGDASARVVDFHESRAGKIAGGSWDTLSTAEIIRDATKGISGREWLGRISRFNSIEVGDTLSVFGFLYGPTEYDRHEYQAVLVGVCEGAYVFAAVNDTSALQNAHNALDIFPEIYNTSHSLWGEREFLYNNKIAIFFYPFPHEFYGGFADTIDPFPFWGYNSNGIESIHCNSNRAPFGSGPLKQMLVHEYQHIITKSYDMYETSWIFEGLARLSEEILMPGYIGDHYDKEDAYDEFLYGDRYMFSYYRTSFRFFWWLYRAYAIDVIISIMRDPYDGEASVARAVGEPWEEVWHQYEVFVESDVNVDSFVDAKDFDIFAPRYMAQDSRCDLNDDGQVDTADLYLFAQQMGISEQAVAKLVAEYTSEPQVVGIQNYPNPFNAHTTIQFMVRERGWVKVQIFNALGQLVTKLHDGEVGAGLFQKKWDGSDVSSGLYIVRAEVNGQVLSSQMTLSK